MTRKRNSQVHPIGPSVPPVPDPYDLPEPLPHRTNLPETRLLVRPKMPSTDVPPLQVPELLPAPENPFRSKLPGWVTPPPLKTPPVRRPVAKEPPDYSRRSPSDIPNIPTVTERISAFLEAALRAQTAKRNHGKRRKGKA